jgi:hypothetical protein
MQEAGFKEVGESRRRCVTEILARREREAARRRVILAPDYVHGLAKLAECYDVFGSLWVERALFVVEGDSEVTVAYFDDYFLVVEQWCEGDPGDREAWLHQRRDLRDREVRLASESVQQGGITLDVGREDLWFWEQGVLGLSREGSDGQTQSGRLQSGQIDVLSLVTLTARLCGS